MPTHIPDSSDLVPRRGSRVLRQVGKLVLRLLGWRISGSLPNLPKFVMALAPHTSHWDFVIGVAAMFAEDFSAHNIGSPNYFRWPFRGIMRRLGAIPRQPVADLVSDIQASESFILTIFPEGTTNRTERWKTGYYYAAKLAQVPILLVSLDYESRTFTYGPTIIPGDDLEADKLRIRNFYEGVQAKNPDKFRLDE